MGGATTYFKHIKDAVVSIFDGMAVTASHLVRKPYTIQYPDRIPMRVQDTLPFRYRGILDVDLEICTGCLACDRACPINCIAIAIEKNAQTREIVISQFDIDIAKCMFCGLCSEPCPTGAIHHTTEFEGADYALESLIRRFIVEPVVAYKPKKGPEPDADAATLLERGMKYVDEWAQPGSDKPPASAVTPKPAPAISTGSPAPAALSMKTAAATPKPAASKPTPASAKPTPAPQPVTAADPTTAALGSDSQSDSESTSPDTKSTQTSASVSEKTPAIPPVGNGSSQSET